MAPFVNIFPLAKLKIDLDIINVAYQMNVCGDAAADDEHKACRPRHCDSIVAHIDTILNENLIESTTISKYTYYVTTAINVRNRHQICKRSIYS